MTVRDFSVDHQLSDRDANIHSVWDNQLEPVLTVDPGEVVRFECRDSYDGQITPGSRPEDFVKADRSSVHPLTGPISVSGLEAGDVLAVDLLEFDHKGWGWTGFMPGSSRKGLLPDEFPEPGLHVWELDGNVGRFVRGIEVPLDPFPGVIGVAPNAAGRHDTVLPRSIGGNLDIKHLTAGSTLYLPAQEDGGLFSIGDCHAAQGDGEVCLTALEAPMFVTARFSIADMDSIEEPQFRSTHPYTPSGADEPMHGTTGISDDLMEASRRAVRHMVDHLETQRDLSREEAYLLCSVAVDLKLNEVVNAPNWVVSAYLPESIFPH